MAFRSARGKVKEFYYIKEPRELRLDLEKPDVDALLMVAGMTNKKLPAIVDKAFGGQHWHPTLNIEVCLTYVPNKKDGSLTFNADFGTTPVGRSNTAIETPEKLSASETTLLHKELVAALTAVHKPVRFAGMKIEAVTHNTEEEVSSRIAKQIKSVASPVSEAPTQSESQEVK